MQTIKENRIQWKTSVLIGAAVLSVHAVILGGVLLSSGCGTTAPRKVEAPPAPVLPPTTEPTSLTGKPLITPPVPVEPAPVMKEPTEGKTYVVQAGDSLDRIARRCGVSSRELMELNGIKNPNQLRIGKKLVLPPFAKEGSAGLVSAPHKTVRKSSGGSKAKLVVPAGGSVYVVQSGDSIERIARRHGIKMSALRAANKLQGDRIRVGQKLAIPGKAEGAAPAAPADAAPTTPETPVTGEVAPATPATPEPAAGPTTLLPYVVQDGQTLDDVAKMFLVKKEDIIRVNNITDPASVKPGDKLQIPASSN